MKCILLISCIIYLYNLSFAKSVPNNLYLELVQVIFRHGDRYPDKGERQVDKSDEYNHIFNNFENYGKLTKGGMKREYEFGKMLRERYNDFLGPYKSQEVYARSTDFDRTKMTLMLALAGLYPPTKETSFDDNIHWSPIPTVYNPRTADFLRVTINGDCVKNGKLLKEIDNSPEVVNMLQTYRDFYEEIRNKTYIKDFKLKHIFKTYAYVRSLLAMDLKLPKWCTQEDFKKLEELTAIHYQTLGLTAGFRKATAGPTIDQLLRNIQENEEVKRKIYLYAAHEINVSTFVQAHNFSGVPPIPDFGSGIIIEQLRGDDNRNYLKMFYWTGVSAKLIPISLQSCDHICLLEDYQKAVKSMIPNDKEKMCYSPLRFCPKNRL